MIVPNKYFWRRSFAYAIDLLICGIVATVFAIVLNNVFSTNILAPSQIKSTFCEYRDDLLSAERMNELMPLKEGQSHRQVLCWQTNMLFTGFYTTRLQKVWKSGNTNYTVNIDYYSDENGNPVNYVSSEPFLYLLAPLIFALFLAKQGRTPGKRLLGLTVYNDEFEKPDLRSALKREYLKAIFLVLMALGGFYTMFAAINFDTDQAAELAQTMSTTLEQSSFLVWAIPAVLIFAVVFWFHFGSFIRWRGRTFWDQFARLNTNHIKEINAGGDIGENEPE